jgi:hypothetical protein
MRTLESALDRLHPELGAQLAAQLSSRENILFCCETRDVEFYEGLPSYAFVITQRRVAYAKLVVRGILFTRYDTSASSMFLSDIISINESNNRDTPFDWYMRRSRVLTVDLRGHGDNGFVFFFVDGPVARKFLTTLKELVNHTRTSAATAKGSPADRLRDLVRLHDEGLVTDAEFQQRRNEILQEL